MGLTWHAHTAKGTALVQTCALVVARVALALIDVDLAARPCEALGAVTPVRGEEVLELQQRASRGAEETHGTRRYNSVLYGTGT